MRITCVAVRKGSCMGVPMSLKNMFIVLAAVAVAVTTTSAGPALAAAVSTEVAVGGSAAAGDHPVKSVRSMLTFVGPTTEGDFWAANCQVSMDTAVPLAKSRVRSGAGVRSIARFSPEVVLPSAMCATSSGFRAVDLGTVSMARVGGTVTASRTDVVPVEVALRFVVPAAFDGACSFVVSGAARGTYDEATQVLTLGTAAGSEDLLVSDEEGCSNVVEGGRARIGTWVVEVSSTDGKINLRP